jgi:hypothetical protein
MPVLGGFEEIRLRRGSWRVGVLGLRIRHGHCVLVAPASDRCCHGSAHDAAGAVVASAGGDGRRHDRLRARGGLLWPESEDHFFIDELDVQITFIRDASGTVTGLNLRQYGRERQATKLK